MTLTKHKGETVVLGINVAMKILLAKGEPMPRPDYYKDQPAHTCVDQPCVICPACMAHLKPSWPTGEPVSEMERRTR